jgi:hypothetical protein
MKRLYRYSLLLLIVILCAGSFPHLSQDRVSSSDRPWQYGDLRLLQSPGDSDPALNIIGAYTRFSGPDLEIRLDFLKLQSLTDSDLYLAIDYQPGGSRSLPLEGKSDLDWDLLVSFRTGYSSKVETSRGLETPRLVPRLYRDLKLDTAVIRLDQADLAVATRHITFQVFVTPSTSKTIASHTQPFDLDGTPPHRAPVLLAFWNSLPASSPAQAMRRWNGAHTGPDGSRHGLFQLLDASERTKIPLTLLDLKTPNSLAGLDILGGLPLVKKLQAQGLLLLPDVAYGDPEAVAESLALTRQVTLNYGLRTSPFLFGPVKAPLPGKYAAVFYSSNQPNILINQHIRYIPLPEDGYSFVSQTSGTRQANSDGLENAVKRSLIKSALSKSASITVLGGSVSASNWAEANVVFSALEYIAAHPWIWALSENDLLTSPSTPENAPPSIEGCHTLICVPSLPNKSIAYPFLNLVQMRASLRQELNQIPPGPERNLAWEMYLELTSTSADPMKAQLQANYLGQVSYLIRAARWSLQPAPFASCEEDIDWDQKKDCILASNSQFNILKTDGARLVFAARLRENGFEELVGPYAQFAIGLGDPHDWQVERGEAGSDPTVVPGAFVDQNNPFQIYQAAAQPGKIRFIAPDAQQEKDYSLATGRLSVSYRWKTSVKTQILVSTTPEVLFQPAWSNRYSMVTLNEQRGIEWGVEAPHKVNFQSSAGPVKVRSFIDSSLWMQQPEDPDQNYPPGHFLPFPLAVIEIQSGNALDLEITE